MLLNMQEGMEEEKMARAISVDQEERQPGLLSRAFAPGSSFARAVSLHNLLDVQHLDTLPESVRARHSPVMHLTGTPCCCVHAAGRRLTSAEIQLLRSSQTYITIAQ